MYTKENLTEMFKGKEFGAGKWFLYLYADGEFAIEETELDVEILDGVIKITTYEQVKNDQKEYVRGDLEGYDYISFERIERISFGIDFIE